MKKKKTIFGAISIVILVLLCTIFIYCRNRKPVGVYYVNHGDGFFTATDSDEETYTFYKDGTYTREYHLAKDIQSGNWELKDGILKLDNITPEVYSIFQYDSVSDSFSRVISPQEQWKKK